jgi:ABC transporter substrate binding protein
MRRREFITLLGGAAAWPLAAYAQQSERVRRIGVLMTFPAADAEAQARVGALLQGLQQLDWAIGRNMRIEVRWAGGNTEDIRRHAAELAALAPDVVVANGSAAVGPLLQATRTVPIVFAIVPDPVGAGFVDSLARPGGNATGFMLFEYGIGGVRASVAIRGKPDVFSQRETYRSWRVQNSTRQGYHRARRPCHEDEWDVHDPKQTYPCAGFRTIHTLPKDLLGHSVADWMS